MSMNTPKQTCLAAATAAALSASAVAGQKKSVDELVAGVRDKSERVRTEAWLAAGQVGAPAVKPLSAVMGDEDAEVARAAKRAMWKIVRHCGRPGAASEKRMVATELRPLLGDSQPTAIRREVLWMLSEISSSRAIRPIAGLLSDKELREDARMVLQRIPGKRSLAALQAGLEAAPDDFKGNIAQSLRQRGVEVPGIGCVKLAPTKKTNVEPVG